MSGEWTYRTSWTTARPATGRITTSRRELGHIAIAFVVLTVDLILMFGGAGLLFGFGLRALAGISVGLVVASAAAAATGFVAHELAHKVSAQRQGYWAEFRMSPSGLLVSLVTAALGFLWAAPGATVVGGLSSLELRRWARTSLAGPLANLGFAAIFFVGVVLTYPGDFALYRWFVLLTWVNAWFGAFNLLPFGPLDGAKVLRWSTEVWIASLLVVGGFAAYATALLYGFPPPSLGV